MRLDQDLIRLILLEIESSDSTPLEMICLNIPGYSKNILTYHVHLLAEAGFIEAQNLCSKGPDGYDWQPKRLTYIGHEFLESIRQEKVWQKTKEITSSLGAASIEITWEIAKTVLADFAKEGMKHLLNG